MEEAEHGAEEEDEEQEVELDEVATMLERADHDRSRDSFYANNAADDEDDRVLAALRVATTTNDDLWTLARLTFLVVIEIRTAHRSLRHESRGVPIAHVRRLAFWTRCRREVHEPWFRRLFEPLEYGMVPLRALEASLITESIDPLAFRNCRSLLHGMLESEFVEFNALHNLHVQLRTMQTILTQTNTGQHRDVCTEDLDFMLLGVNSCLHNAQTRRALDPHAVLLNFQAAYLHSTQDDVTALDLWSHDEHTQILQMRATLAELTDPNPVSSIRLDDRIRAMLAELGGMLSDAQLAFPEWRRCMWMVAHIELEDLLLHLNAVMRLRQEWRAERRQALALAWLPVLNDQQAPPVAAMDDDLLRSIERLSLDKWTSNI